MTSDEHSMGSPESQHHWTIAIQQPLFVPYIEFFSLIHASSEWISFDTAQYVRKSWYNRNRILNAKSEPQWIGVPVAKHSQKTALMDIRIASQEDWASKILGQLLVYRKRAPYFNKVCELLEEAFFESDSDLLIDLNEQLLSRFCSYLGMPFNPIRFSSLGLEIPTATPAGEWATAICSALKKKSYVSLSPSESIMNIKSFEEASIEIQFIRQRFHPYSQRIPDFVSHLSIIDLLMFNSPEEALAQVRNYQISPSTKQVAPSS